jgi:hypothetical protein
MKDFDADELDGTAVGTGVLISRREEPQVLTHLLEGFELVPQLELGYLDLASSSPRPSMCRRHFMLAIERRAASLIWFAGRSRTSGPEKSITCPTSPKPIRASSCSTRSAVNSVRSARCQ